MSSRAVTITPNPAIDQTVRLANLQPGHVHRARSSRDDAAAKASTWPPAWQTGACRPLRWACSAMATTACSAHCFPIRHRRRVSAHSGSYPHQHQAGGRCQRRDHRHQPARPVTVRRRSGRGIAPTRRTAPAGAAGGAVRQPSVRAASRCMGPTAGVVQRRRRARTAGYQWRRACGVECAQGALPYAVKPNRHELEAAGTRRCWIAAPRAAGSGPGRTRSCTRSDLDGADGALFIDRSGALVARPARLAQGSTVGAGDAMVAGIAAALLEPSPTWPVVRDHGVLDEPAGEWRRATAGPGAGARVDRRCTDRAVGLKPLQRGCGWPWARWPLLQGRTRRIPGVAMQASTVVIAAGERSIEAVLAAEALRRAARQQRVELAIEIRSNQGVTGALSDAQAAAATQLLLVVTARRTAPASAMPRSCAPASVKCWTTARRAGAARRSIGTPFQDDAGKRIVAVTSCPTGIAHTFAGRSPAAGGTRHWATRSGWKPRARSAQDALSDGEIAAADLVLIAADREVDLSRLLANACSRAAPSRRSMTART